jgi:hypothetical protein
MGKEKDDDDCEEMIMKIVGSIVALVVIVIAIVS